jgi:DNA-binding Lrp family transcriptional regulator
MTKKAAATDTKDDAIISCLKESPEILLKNIPGRIKGVNGLGETIPYTTVQKHVNKLIKNKVVSRIFSVNLGAAGYTSRYRIDILIEPVEFRKMESDESEDEGASYTDQRGLAKHIIDTLARDERFAGDLIIEDVNILIGGDVDLSLDVYAKNDKTATEFVIDGLRKLPGVGNTRTAKLAWSCKHGWMERNGLD